MEHRGGSGSTFVYHEQEREATVATMKLDSFKMENEHVFPRNDESH